MGDLAGAYQASGKFDLAVPLLKEALAMSRKTSRKDSSELSWHLAGHMTSLGQSMFQAKAYVDAELIVRESLVILEKSRPDRISTFKAKALLGVVLLDQQKYADAEPLLLASYEGMKASEARIGDAAKFGLRVALTHLVRLYEAKGEAKKIIEWKQKLAEFEQAEGAKKPAAPPGAK